MRLERAGFNTFDLDFHVIQDSESLMVLNRQEPIL